MKATENGLSFYTSGLYIGLPAELVDLFYPYVSNALPNYKKSPSGPEWALSEKRRIPFVQNRTGFVRSWTT
ncbi:hypothetical protein [Spirosoma linguale]|uniref:hypothetical protein n=1 Tax=Spirosoma linguale TaxID=108 RepID=UPI0002E40843